MARARVVLIGVGMVSSVYVDALANLSDSVELAGVLGSKPASGQAFVDKYGEQLGRGVAVFDDVQAIAADDGIDFAIITTPPNARRDLVEALAAGGKPILMEKPVERTPQQAAELCDICEAAGVPLGIVLQHRARPSAVALAERLKTDDFGPLHAVEISVPWWRPQSYYDEPGRGTYSRDGGGVLISQAIHTLDLALQFTGPVESVSALAATSGFHEMEAEDFVSAGVRFANGAVGNLMASTVSYPGRTEEIILHFGNVTVRLQSSLLELAWQDGRNETIGASSATGAGADPMAFTSDWHRSMIEDFVEVVRTGKQPIASGRSALAVQTLIAAIETSSRTGKIARVSG